jgi:tripeptidyl-peptidase-2
MGGGKSFTVAVDPRSLEAGAHFAEVLGFDSSCPERGPLLRLPVTVLVPVATPSLVDSKESKEIQANTYRFPSLSFISGQIIRKFITVPPNASWAEAIVTAKGFENRRTFMLHVIYSRHHVVSSCTV